MGQPKEGAAAESGSEPDVLVRAEKLRVVLGRRVVLHDIDLTIHEGRIVTLVGTNGAGKSTLLLALIGLTAPTAGWVERVRGLRVGYVPQHFRIDPSLPISVRRFLRLSGRSARRRWEEVVGDTGIGALLDSPMQGLSGGEMRRVLLARALLQRPRLLALDEPAAGLDGPSQSALYALIRTVRDRHGCAVVVVSHDLNLVMAASDEVLCLDGGRILCRGNPASVVAHPEYLSLFGSHLGPETAVFPHDHHHDGHHGAHRAAESEGHGERGDG